MSDLPRLDTVRHPATYLLTPLRPAARWLVRRRFGVRLHGADAVPATGPVIFVSNHTGWADGPLLAIFAPRPVHALTKSEMFAGRLGRFLAASGQIRLDRLHPDPHAIKTCLRVLRDGHAVGVFPEGTRGTGDFATMRHGAAYLAMVSGAPVVPVVMFGVRQPGESSSALPTRGSTVDIVFGTPWQTSARPWPRRRDDVAAATEELGTHLRVALDRAREVTGRDLPGPLPAGDKENQPGQELAEGTAR